MSSQRYVFNIFRSHSPTSRLNLLHLLYQNIELSSTYSFGTCRPLFNPSSHVSRSFPLHLRYLTLLLLRVSPNPHIHSSGQISYRDGFSSGWIFISRIDHQPATRGAKDPEDTVSGSKRPGMVMIDIALRKQSRATTRGEF